MTRAGLTTSRLEHLVDSPEAPKLYHDLWTMAYSAIA